MLFSKGQYLFILKLVKLKSGCFTGHRNQKLIWVFNESEERCLEINDNLCNEIEKAINSGYETFYSGMTFGFDQIYVETILELKKHYNNVKNVVVLPCKAQDVKCQIQNKEPYRKLIRQLDGVRCIFRTL